MMPVDIRRIVRRSAAVFGLTIGAALLAMSAPLSHLIHARAQSAQLDANGQDDVILKRQTLMELIYEFANEDDIAEDVTQLRDDANAIIQRLTEFKTLFPQETNPAFPQFKASYPTYAKPDVWQQSDVFSQYLDETIAATRDIVGVSDQVALEQKANRILTTCEQCHDKFRRPLQLPIDEGQKWWE